MIQWQDRKPPCKLSNACILTTSESSAQMLLYCDCILAFVCASLFVRVLMSCPHGAMGLSVIHNCDIFWSYLRAFLLN